MNVEQNVATVLPRGRVTIPASIRRKLKIEDGSKVVFIEENGEIKLLNAARAAFDGLEKSFENEPVPWASEEEMLEECRAVRGEMWEKRKHLYEGNA